MTRTATPELKPRYGRITAFGTSTLVCGLTFLGGLGVLPTGATAQAAAQAPAHRADGGTLELSGSLTRSSGGIGATSTGSQSPRSESSESTGSTKSTGPSSQSLPAVPDDASTAAKDAAEFPVPEDSGEGRRVVFDLQQQRVWLVKANEKVKRTYLASGSLTDNLRAGTYEVYSRSEDATGIDGTTMRWMVRFTRGDNAAIGFHDLPLGDDGRPVQRLRDLGTPQSHGCIRQAPGDARALWRFAPIGTQVVVTGSLGG
jgi:lipoprotein-anchoring transpeptidase ErfK/SrfK